MMASSGKIARGILVFLLVVLGSSLRAASQSVFIEIANITHNSAFLSWDIPVEGATVQAFQISVDCRLCVPFDVSANTASTQLTELKDNTRFQACVTPFTEAGLLGSECISFRTYLSPRTVGALCVGLFLVVSFFVLLAMDLLCRRHQIEVEDAKRDELLEQGWQTFKRSSTGRVGKKISRASAAPSMVHARSEDDGFQNVGDVTFEEDLPE
ncbi:uncharacterized protein LOC100891976 [Strongylocentrotus purpuratus]|uniref:Fibronectin type-III domain-containing protein n=1 Tax=Strongylocentrotus purpuratus TaxID=7668 RepID=A0A7M7HLL0_STRPU|nr:uncharacterized protein LOC100891976 [Strongylocentrotus purpuratus]XP_011668806.1 uncharacterized protein LOC100891976 [Strongylocentrotus purpuratus]XP_011668807.1 uncharacterized protein LOC100891976 [Strongylocentrotus purpuratus]XP_011668808.1 uncharacterized protein LOC100891976 [Strongylocentrotus purpuratus]|eukprot:XP_003725323.1 PREDICTED: uncharacterized protein LOC100891976 [Strongylocentrotus purpuratus]